MNKLVLPLYLMKMEKVGNVLDLIVFLAAAPSLVVIFWSLIWFLPLYSLSSWWLFSWSRSFHFNTKLGIVVINLEEIGGVWSSFYWYAIFKMFEQILVHFLTWNVFVFPDQSTKTLFTSFVQVFTSFSFFGEKKTHSQRLIPFWNMCPQTAHLSFIPY